MAKKLDTAFKRVHIVNHSHIDLTWWNPPDVCRRRNEEIIDRVIELCESDAEFRFSYETAAGLRSYLEDRPERKDALRRLIGEGRLDVGGLFVSANTGACSEETVARNFYLGKRWLETVLGYSPTIAKEFDTPGHTLQMPQLVTDAGLEALVITRGPQGCFVWTGPDGSRLLTCCIPYNWSYWRKLGVSFEQTERNMDAELDRAADKFSGPELIIPDGDDMTLPNPNLLGIIERWNQSYDRPKLTLSTLEAAMEGMQRRNLPRRSGDIPNMWVAIHCLQVETTRHGKLVQNLLPILEALHSIACIIEGKFKRYPSEKIDSCWRQALLVTDHNWGGKDETRGGAEGDEHKEELAKGALRRCNELAEDAFFELAKTVMTDENPPGMPVMVLNSLTWDRTDVAVMELGCELPGLEAVEIVDHDERPVPFDATVLKRHPDGTISRLQADFLVRDLPSMGYSGYYLKPLLQRPAEAAAPRRGNVIENEFYRIELAEDGSHIASLYDKQLDLELAGRFNVNMGPFEFEFGLFELFGIGLRLTVPDDSFYENPENQGSGESVEPTGEMWRAADYPAKTRVEQNGSLGKSLVVEGDFINSRRRQRIVLYDGLKRVDLHLELDWAGVSNAVVYLQMPNTLMNGRRFIDVPFAVHRDGNELKEFWINEDLPIKFKVREIQDWLCFEDGGRGLAVATRWPVLDLTMVPAFPLIWTNDASGFFFGERYRQAGTHKFSFSLTSYEGGWLENEIHRWGRQWAKPPLTFTGDSGAVPSRYSYLSLDARNVILSALKKAHDEDAIVLRLYEVAGEKTEARLRTSFPIRQARATNLTETASGKLSSDRNSVKLAFRPHEVKTVKIYV